MSKELEALKTFEYIMAKCQEEDSYIIKFPLGVQKGTTFGEDMQKAHSIITQALNNYEEFKKVLQIIYIKQVDIGRIFTYNGISNTLNLYNQDYLEAYQLTQEELDLILKVKDLLFPGEVGK